MRKITNRQSIQAQKTESSSTSTWRLLPLINANGAVQMAIDRWLLQQHKQGQHPPTLRFYTWSEPTISLGYHQQDYPQFWHQLNWQGKPLKIVRRPTGGKAVLHQGDLTYAVIASFQRGKRLEVYQQICQFLITGWRSLGINLFYGQETNSYRQQDNCFKSATGADLITDTGIKLIGSAQLRQGKAILQHGSMLLKPNPELYYQAFAQPAPPPLQQLLPDAVTLSVAKISEVLTQAASQCFKIDLVEQPLSAHEWQDIFANYPLLT
jgi:lipoate-protein ligase A